MGELREKHTIFGPFPDADPIDTALLFLRTNRYQLVSSDRSAPPPELQVEPISYPTEEPAGDDSSPDEAEAPAGSMDGDVDTGGPSSNAEEASEEDAEQDEDGGEEEEDDRDEDAADEPPEEVLCHAVLRRGEKRSGYFSSNMADLRTEVTLVLDKNSVRLEYLIDTSGQLLREDEREFWKREARAVEAYVKGEAGNITNLAQAETERATAARRDRMGTGLWIAAIVFFIVFVVGVILVRM